MMVMPDASRQGVKVNKCSTLVDIENSILLPLSILLSFLPLTVNHSRASAHTLALSIREIRLPTDNSHP